ncbi:hypothetical protein ACKQTC_06150 [Peptococcus simiae]|uniref:Uncharacterized protein n=1 Tax=Peptococcus simiae TaxID=1643805 RepID=A0ABW9H063_9FIRM
MRPAFTNQQLLFIAGLVWLIAGLNVLRIGLRAFPGYLNCPDGLLTLAIFYAFIHFVFGPLVRKNTARITAYPTLQPFYRFLDRKGFIVMTLMISLGISLRQLQLLPDVCIAVFYSGLGAALSLAGLLFFRQYRLTGRQAKPY